MSNIVIANGAVEKNIPTIGSRLFNIYLGPRVEKEDFFEKLGQVYIFCLSKALGKQITLIEGKPCDVKTAQIGFRIFFGAVAIITMPITFIGILLTARSKSQKNVHEAAINSLKIINNNEPVEAKKEEPKVVIAPPKEEKPARPNPPVNPPKPNRPTPVKRERKPRVVFEWPKPQEIKKENEKNQAQDKEQPKDPSLDDKKKAPEPPPKPPQNQKEIDKEKPPLELPNDIPEELKPVTTDMENKLKEFSKKLEDAEKSLTDKYAPKLQAVLENNDSVKKLADAAGIIKMIENDCPKVITDINNKTDLEIVKCLKVHSKIINKNKETYRLYNNIIKDKQKFIFDEYALKVNEYALQIKEICQGLINEERERVEAEKKIEKEEPLTEEKKNTSLMKESLNFFKFLNRKQKNLRKMK